MLSLQLKSGDYLTIGDDIAVQVFEEPGSSFRVAVKAPKEIPILRGEVHERSGKRPDGLLSKRSKSPSERRYDAKHYDAFLLKREQREAQYKSAEEEKTAITHELMDLADQLDNLIATCGSAGVQEQLKNLSKRLGEIEFPK